MARPTNRSLGQAPLALIAMIVIVGFAPKGCAAAPTPSEAPPSQPAPTPTAARRLFDGSRALDLVRAQLEFGPRVTGSAANAQAAEWIVGELRAQGWPTQLTLADYHGTPIRNIVARRGSGPAILLGAHWDSRRRADRDPAYPDRPGLGAEDGASGTAVLLELARTLELDWESRQVWLVLFDAEDNGGLDGWDWIVGSTLFAQGLSEPEVASLQAAVIVDMVGDRSQRFSLEHNSDAGLQQVLWGQALALGYGAQFVDEPGGAILDDHLPFRALGIPAVDIIDIDYPYWHTTEDTLDKVSAESLERVGRTLEAWLESGAPLGR